MKLVTWAKLGIVAGMAWSAPAQVQLRGGARLDAPVREATLVGLWVGPGAAGGEARVVSWDRVKRVEGERAANGEPFRAIADKLWRARTRVERGDYAAAEPLLDELAQAYGAEGGPSAAVVAECLLRCRLSRGAQGAATSAWLWWTWLVNTDSAWGGSRSEWIGGATDLPPLVDAATGLAPTLPPVWAPVASTGAAAASTEWQRQRARGGEVGELAELYEKSARFEAGMDDEISLTGAPAGGEQPAGPGVSLVRDMVLARGGDAEARASARAGLEARLRAMAAAAEAKSNGKAGGTASARWVEAWCRLALGRSLIREKDTALRMRGVIELLHVPARFSSEQPFLAGIALADAAVTMANVGDDRAAAALKAELLMRHPGHPVTQWEELGKIKEGAATPRRSITS